MDGKKVQVIPSSFTPVDVKEDIRDVMVVVFLLLVERFNLWLKTVTGLVVMVESTPVN